MNDTPTEETEAELPIERQLAADLRALADWIETRPLIATQMRHSFETPEGEDVATSAAEAS